MSALLRLPRTLALLLGVWLSVVPAVQAGPACLEPGGGGIGGTGAIASGGVGGTGAPVDDGGIGGTGDRPGKGGIGGTGERPDDGGIGGTGILGTITGFGSICVNGVEVHYDSKVPLSENGVPAHSGRLAIGQVVAVQAQASPRGLEARRIAILNAYEGPVTQLATADAPLRVMGQPVRLATDARVAPDLRPGEPVRVSGLRNARGEVVASRIERAPGLAQASAVGAVERPGQLQGLALSRTLPVGAEVLVRGAWNGERLRVDESRADPGLSFDGATRRVLVEGLVHSRQGDRVAFGGFTAELQPGTAVAGKLAVNQRIRVSGVLGAGRSIRADRIEVFAAPREDADHQGRGKSGDSDDSDDSDHSGRGSGHDDSREESGHSGREDSQSRGSGNAGEIRERVEREVESASGELERRERIETRESADRIETRERIEIFENGQRVERIERIERIDKPDRVDKPERVERVEKIERVERPDKVERPEQLERVDRVDHSGPH